MITDCNCLTKIIMKGTIRIGTDKSEGNHMTKDNKYKLTTKMRSEEEEIITNNIIIKKAIRILMCAYIAWY